MTRYSLTPGVLIERVGEDLMVIVPGRSDIVRLSGPTAQVLLDVQAGRGVSSNHPLLTELGGLGVLSLPDVSRRGLIRAGVVGAGAGIAVMAIPSIAAASSGGGGDGGPLLLTRLTFPTFWETTTGVKVNDNPLGSTFALISVFVWDGGVDQGDKKADWDFYGATNWNTGVFQFEYARSMPADITQILMTFTIDGGTYEALYTAPI